MVRMRGRRNRGNSSATSCQARTRGSDMMRRCLGAALLALALGTPAHAAEPIAQVSGLVRETITVPFGPTPVALEAVVTRPAGAGKYPLLGLSHGTPRNADDPQHVQPNAHSDVAIAFAARGWAGVAVCR